MTTYLRKRFYLPPEKGGWVWWIGPLLVGVAASQRISPVHFPLILAAFCAFCMRQPIIVLIRSLRWKEREDLAPAAFWMVIYGTVILFCAGWLALLGHSRIVLIGLPGLPVLLAHLVLVYLGRERRQPVIDVAATLALALAAPAAYWAGNGTDPWTTFLAWATTAPQSAASVVHILLRLQQSRWETAPSFGRRLLHARWVLGLHGFNAVVSAFLVYHGLLPPLVAAGFLMVLLEGMEAVFRPPVGATAKSLGIRQLVTSTAFMVFAALGFLLR